MRDDGGRLSARYAHQDAPNSLRTSRLWIGLLVYPMI